MPAKSEFGRKKHTAAPTFSSAAYNISDRTTTTESAVWDQPAWSSGNQYKTPVLVDLVQEVVDEVAEGSSLSSVAFIFEPAASGKISAASFEDPHPLDRPVLHLRYAICDRDKDGIADIEDEDDDNDGIPDYVEGACSSSEFISMQPLDGSSDPVSDFNGAVYSILGAKYDHVGSNNIWKCKS